MGGAIVIDTASFQFVINPIEPIILPPYKGSTLRGGFGATFRRIVCVAKDKVCGECLLKSKCVYSYIFETPPPADTKNHAKIRGSAPPFYHRATPNEGRATTPGSEIAFGLVLVGRAIDYLPYFIYTFDELGKAGLGKGRGSSS